MGLFSHWQFWPRRRKTAGKQRATHSEAAVQRHCTFETMEPRRMLSANPLVLGTVYVEEDLGSDLHGDRFELTFAGGAPETELTRLIINGDQNTPGFGVGDVFFDTVEGGLGADHAAGFQVEQLISDNPNARVEAHVTDGESLLILDFYGFKAGDKLVFSMDVDEVEYYDPAETDPDIINDGFDPITSGVEFQGSQLTAFFSAPHYKDADGSAIFWNRYDDALEASGLDLPEDNTNGLRDRTTGAFLDARQVVDPAAISGYVYADNSNDGQRDQGEQGLAGVALQVVPIDTIAPQSTVTVMTDARGFYEAIDLSPGTYRVVEVNQPAGYLDGLDTAGTVGGVRRGAAVNPGDRIEAIFLGGGTRGVEYNFGEILPTSIEGSVYLSDADGNCYAAGGASEPLAGVTVQLLDEQGNLIAQTETDTLGDYAFTGLAPGVYSVIELTPDGLIDDDAHAGTIGPSVRGRTLDANSIVDINLNAGDRGVDYDFCEYLPSLISGYVYHDRNDNGLRETGEEAIAGVRVTLKDQDGNTIGVNQTNADGYYEFAGLSAGSYRLVETQPGGWLDGKETVGRVDGVPSGSSTSNDTIRDATLRWGSNGVDYNFGELQPGSIQGVVYADIDRDCQFDPDESPIAGVLIELLDDRGSVIATTRAGSDGQYRFDDLMPARYAVRETQPDGYFHGSQAAGSHGGDDSLPDLISRIPVGSGQQLVDYDFCEIVPGSISGIVYVDPNQNERFDSGELLLEGVTVQLLDATGRVVGTARTDQAGYYEFTNLRPGTYGVHELQPGGYFHGGQQAGSHGGNDVIADLISAVAIGAGEDLIQYNFSELPPSSIQGVVYVSTSPSCTVVPDAPIPGVTVELLDRDGVVVGTTRTDQNGRYQFDNLPPGEYSVREFQPDGYFQGGQCAGTGGGNDLTPDLISDIQIGAGVHLVSYNFSEVPPATLSGYVFQDGPVIQTPDGGVPDNLAAIRNGRRTADDSPIAGVVLELRHGINGHAIMADNALDGTYPEGPITAVTDANGYYEFKGLRPGTYAIFEIHPPQYIDGIDTPGSTSGLPVNLNSQLGAHTLGLLAKDPAFDAIIRIPLMAGQTSVENNFSEVLVGRLPPPPILPPVQPSVWNPISLVAPPPVPLRLTPTDLPRAIPTIPLYGSSSQLRMTWHLSVIDGGTPRGTDPNQDAVDGVWQTISYLNHTQWISVAMNRGYWAMPEEMIGRLGDPQDGIVFGIPGAIPLAGDFNGDGISEICLFQDGQWFVDFNGNGRWDEEDLWAKLGTQDDLPVVGDWDGDGKDDIGIFGPEWRGDERAIKAEPGLPDPQNVYRMSIAQETCPPKNLPPEPAEATDGHRVLKRSAQGNPRLDLIDHVFRFGVNDDVPIAGDWNGDGIRSIGVFRHGTWYLDADADGRLTERDTIASYGTHGDRPVVGDFNADGIDEIGVYRDGTWILDINGNRELDAHDQVFRLGGAQDKPVVGDWDGDGKDDPAVYRDAG